MKTYKTSKTVKKRIYKLLQNNAKINAEWSGTDVTKTQKAEAMRKIKENAKKIKEIDLEYWEATFKLDL